MIFTLTISGVGQRAIAEPTLSSLGQVMTEQVRPRSQMQSTDARMILGIRLNLSRRLRIGLL